MDSQSSFQNRGLWTLNRNLHGHPLCQLSQHCPQPEITLGFEASSSPRTSCGQVLGPRGQVSVSGLNGCTRLSSLCSHTWSVERWGLGIPTSRLTHDSTSPHKSISVILQINYLPPCSLQTFTILDKDKNMIFPVRMEAMPLFLPLSGAMKNSEPGSWRHRLCLWPWEITWTSVAHTPSPTAPSSSALKELWLLCRSFTSL